MTEYLSSSLFFSGVRITRSLILCVCFVDRCLSFVLFLMANVLSVFLRYTDSDYPFSVFKLFYIHKRRRIEISENISTWIIGRCYYPNIKSQQNVRTAYRHILAPLSKIFDLYRGGGNRREPLDHIMLH